MIHGLPSSFAGPAIEIAPHGRKGRKVPEQLAPKAAGRDDIQDRLHDTAASRCVTPQLLPYSSSSRQYCVRVISVQVVVISSGCRKPMNHNLLK